LIYVWHYFKLRANFAPLDFRSGFISGAVVTLLASVLNLICFSIFYYFINPDLFNALQAYAVKSNLMTQQEAQQYFNLSSYLTQLFFGSLIMGLIFSLILTLIFKNKIK